MFSKIDVNGPNAAPLYVWLKAQQPGDGESSDIGWNFAKFLVDPEGRAIARFSPRVTPAQIGEAFAALRMGS